MLDHLVAIGPTFLKPTPGSRKLRGRIAAGEAERAAVRRRSILLEAEPGALVVQDGGALVGGVRVMLSGIMTRTSPARRSRAVREDPNGLRTNELAPACMVAAVEAPQRQPPSAGKLSNSLICAFPRKLGRGVAVEPYVFVFIFRQRVSHKLVTRSGLEEDQRACRARQRDRPPTDGVLQASRMASYAAVLGFSP